MNVCYVPDSFGSMDSLPLIAAGFDTPYVLFGRGRSEAIPSGVSCLIWDGPDGSRVLAANHGYANAITMSYPDIWTDIDRAHPDPDHVLAWIRQRLANDPQAERGIPAYLAVGIDHMEPRPSLSSIVKHIDASMDEVDLVFGSPEDFFRDVSEHCPSHLPVIHGEMRGPDVKCFNGCLSSHIDLKQMNFKSQRWMARYCEPLSALACEAGQPYPTAFLDHLWRLLLVNHAHDSICGCSLDSVHDDMRNRYARIEQAATILCEKAADKVAAAMCLQHERADAVPLVVSNTLGHTRSDVVQQWVRIPSRFAHSSYHILSDVGDLIPGVVNRIALKQKDLESVYMSVSQLGAVLSKNASEERPDDDVFTVLDVNFLASDVPAMGARTFWLLPGTAAAPHEPEVVLTERGMRNKHCEVVFNPNGTFDVLDRSSGRLFPALHAFEDTEEVGDAYGHKHYDQPDVRSTRKLEARIEKTEVLPHAITYSVTHEWPLPVTSSTQGRSRETEMVAIHSLVTLRAQSSRVEVVTTIENTCRNHRLRAVFDMPFTAEDSSAEGNFSLTRRPIPRAGEGMEAYPQQSMTVLADGASCFALFKAVHS